MRSCLYIDLSASIWGSPLMAGLLTPPNMTDGRTTKVAKIYRQLLSVYRILPNKRACLNKCSPNFFLWSGYISIWLNWSESYFQHIKFRYSGVHPATFIEIRPGWGFIFCLRARRVYSATYSIRNIGVRVIEFDLLDDGQDGKYMYNAIMVLVSQRYKIFVTQDTFIFGTEPFDTCSLYVQDFTTLP